MWSPDTTLINEALVRPYFQLIIFKTQSLILLRIHNKLRFDKNIFSSIISFFLFLTAVGQSSPSHFVTVDKSSKLYVGIDNPITINPPIDTLQTKISIKNGTISLINNQWIIRVEEEGETQITLETKNQKTEIPLRSVFIPDPSFTLGLGKARIPFIEFKTFRTCEALLDKFEFDVRFKVLSADVYFWGIGFSYVRTSRLIGNDLTMIADLMNLCQPGSVVTFDNIHVEGPDGIRVIESKSYALY